MKKVMLIIAIVFLSLNMGNAVFAEEGSYTEGSHEMAEVAIDGYCPVCVVGGKMMKGSDEFQTEYEGNIYKFPGEKQKTMFLDDPEKYVDDIDSKYADLKKQSTKKYEGSR